MKTANCNVWGPFLERAKEYLLSLKCKAKNKDEFVKMYTTTRGTFVKGLVTSISGLQLMMRDIENGKLKLE